MKTKEELIYYLDNEFLIKNNDAKVSIPNDIFLRLKETESMKNSQQLSFCFSYLVLNAFLSKYCAYWDYDGKSFITKKDMKVILGYNRENKTVNGLIKVNGVLEQKDFLTHETDIPIFYGIEKDEKSLSGNFHNTKDWVLSFISDMPIQIQEEYNLLKRTGNSSFSAPIPNFILGTGDNQSTLNDRNLTFTVQYKTFRNLLFRDDFSLTEFSIFYFMQKTAYKNTATEISYEQMLSQLGISRSTLKESLTRLEAKKLIEIIDTGYSSSYVPDKYGNLKHIFSRNIRKYKVYRG